MNVATMTGAEMKARFGSSRRDASEEPQEPKGKSGKSDQSRGPLQGVITSAGPYRTTADGIYRIETKEINGGRVEIPYRLTNFTAAITADISTDDGAEVNRELELEVRVGKESTKFSIPAQQFVNLSRVLL